MKYLLLLVSALLTVSAGARTLTPAEALQRAEGNQAIKSENRQQLRLVKTGYTPKRLPAYYIYDHAGAQGFMIVSADDVAMPILGYSDSGMIDPDNMPDNMREWLSFYAQEIEWASERQSSGEPYLANGLSGNTINAHNSWEPIAPLCSTKWNQGTPYNLYTPALSNGNCATGCTATAMAQLMKYHNYPTTGTGSASYKWRNPETNVTQTLSMDFSTVTFNWDKMLDVYESNNYTSQSAEAVAKLMQACGYSVSMAYGPASGAGTASVVTALKNYFGYDPNTRLYYRQYYSLDEWEEMLYNNLKNVGPIHYSGANESVGHAFIIDGYSGNGYFHLNWGWGGMSDGDFLITALDPENQGIGGSMDGYNIGQLAIIGAKPGNGPVEPLPFEMGIYTEMTPSVSSSNLTLSGRFDNIGDTFTGAVIGLQFCDYYTDESEGVSIDGFYSEWQRYYYTTEISSTIPSDLQAKTYKVYPVYSIDNKNTFHRAKAGVGVMPYVVLTKNSDGTYSVAANKNTDLVFDNFTLDSPIYADRNFKISAEIHNPHSIEIMQEISLGFIDATTNRLIAKCPTIVADLRGGENLTLPIINSISQGSLEAGKTYAMAYYDTNALKVLSDPITVTVLENPGYAVLKLVNNGFSVADYNNVNAKDIHISYNVYCQEGFYDYPLYVYMFDANDYSNVDALTTSALFMDAGEYASANNLSIGAANLTPGKRYIAILYYRSGAYNLDYLNSGYIFTVGSTFNSIDTIKTDGNDASVKASINNGTLSITADSEIKTIDIYNMSGAKVASSDFSPVNISDVQKGVYIVKVITAQGIASFKIIR